MCPWIPDLTERRLSRPPIVLFRSSTDFSFFGMAIFEGIVDIRTLEVLFSLFLPPDGARQFLELVRVLGREGGRGRFVSAVLARELDRD